MGRHRPARRRTKFVPILAATVLFSGCMSQTRQSRDAVGAASSGKTLRVVSTQATYQGLDPQAVYNAPELELLRCCLLRALMTYRGLPDIDGTQPVPDLATAPPTASPDGLTWTFHLREGIHYAPPMEDVEVTAGDIIRALLRAGSRDAGLQETAGSVYLPLIEGFSEYAAGKAAAISGVSTPDDFTLRVEETRPDTSIVHLFAEPFSAPIPPLPSDPSAPLGAATGHPFDTDFPGLPRAEGYGRFLVASGPYMVEGAPDLDFSLPPDQQEALSGFTPAWFNDERFDPGQITLVRNPSWDSATDPNRPAFADRIEISVRPGSEGLYDALDDGNVDVIMAKDPPADILKRYRSLDSLRDRIATTAGSLTLFATINLAQPPFDDVHVRRAFALALDRRALSNHVSFSGTASFATHLVPDPLEGSFLPSWDPFGAAGDAGNTAAAREEMKRSKKYGESGRCSGGVCRDVIVGGIGGSGEASIVGEALAELGIQAKFPEGEYCTDPATHFALCIHGGWAVDYPDAGNMFTPLLSSADGNIGHTLLGSTPDELRSWHYGVRHVPSIDADYDRCAAELGVRAALCWARLDQLIVGQLVAIIPLSQPGVVRLEGVNVAEYSLDQAFVEPSLDRVALAGWEGSTHDSGTSESG